MAVIKLLSETLISQIAAGEVIERPASVVKELVENSIDAGADQVEIEMNEGGKSYIKIVDNGGGIEREFLPLALERHATSKIGSEEDLWKIGTMGFRGEALASIASVSKIVLKSRCPDADFGGVIEVKGGVVGELEDVGMSVGTQIEVKDLFFNTPARKKYLKQDGTELQHTTGMLNAMALAKPDVALKLVHNGKVVLDFPKVTDLSARIEDVFGKATREAMLPVFYGGNDFQLSGYVGKPVLNRSSSKNQYIFVNGRVIQHHLIANRVKAAYKTMLMENKKPVFILDIKIDPAMIDVNVHPRKLEIRFENQQDIVHKIYKAVGQALDNNNLMPKGFSESQRYMSDGLSSSFGQEGKQMKFGEGGNSYDFKPKFGGGSGGVSVGEALYFSRRMMGAGERYSDDRDGDGGTEFKKEPMKAIAQVYNSYIVASDEEGLVLVDQHAAHEKVRYETLMKEFYSKEKSSQALLLPVNIDFSKDELLLMKDNMDVFEGLGFEIEDFGGNTMVVSAVPAALAKEGVEEVIKGVVDDLEKGEAATNLQGRVEEILTYMSCRSAIKFGQGLSLLEMQKLLEDLHSLDRPYTCPHGRPTMVKLTVDDLGRMFGRK
ncbi:DNA mismatch repair protein MutL [Candidatus Peregrinibacteria bacterium HGW-Peregrinibacteria-1]|jgi:DNA mismatch repair protein MutL|nr:MAG: DNA mismatch repair protein MutL [Candidatus Peregrinibacteria bacterium HGW-Peregrinibacteria-1]